MRPATASGEKPPKMTEWIAPIRAQASMATAAAGMGTLAIEREPVDPQPWTPGTAVPEQLAPLLGHWYTEGSHLVLSVRQGQLEARLAAAESPVPVSVVDSTTMGMAMGFAALAGARSAVRGEGFAAVEEVIAKVKAAGKIVGVNAFVPAQADAYAAAGADYVNVGADVALLARAAEALADRWCPAPIDAAAGGEGAPRASY